MARAARPASMYMKDCMIIGGYGGFELALREDLKEEGQPEVQLVFVMAFYTSGTSRKHGRHCLRVIYTVKKSSERAEKALFVA